MTEPFPESAEVAICDETPETTAHYRDYTFALLSTSDEVLQSTKSRRAQESGGVVITKSGGTNTPK